jgi:hypothetical protein
MRRFAFVNVCSPEEDVYRDLVKGPGELVARLLPLRQLQDIGPAVFLDAADYVTIRNLDGVSASVVLLEAFSAYFLPQLDALTSAQGEWLLDVLDDLLEPSEQEALRGLLREFNVLPAA